MAGKKRWAAVVSVALSVAGLVLAAGHVLQGDRWSAVWLAVFAVGVWVTAVELRREDGTPKFWKFLDVLLFAAGLALALFYSRYRLQGLLLVMAFPFRQMVGQTPAAEESEQAEKKNRFDAHKQR